MQERFFPVAHGQKITEFSMRGQIALASQNKNINSQSYVN